MNIVEAIKDEALFRPFLQDRDGSLSSWAGWMSCLRAVYGLPVPKARREFFREVTGRDATKLPADGFDTALFLTGRRSGKSRISAVIGAYEAAVANVSGRLAPGEDGIVAVCAPTKKQAAIVRNGLRAAFKTPLLARELVAETKEGFELKNQVRIDILAGDFRTVRGFTLLAAITDEICFFQADSDGAVKSDTELVRAIKPALATTGGKLVAISSPYAPRGWAFDTWKRNFGNDVGRTLVVNAPSRTLNPTLPQSVIDDAYAEDPAAARSEFNAQWRDDIAAFLPRAVVESLVVKDRLELLPDDRLRYVAFVDMSGGRSDEAVLAIAHNEGRRLVVLDKLVRYRPPFNPTEVVALMAEELRRFNVRRVVGDNYAAEYTAGAFNANDIRYAKAEKPKSALYLELLPRLCSGEVELLDHPALIDQLAGLERRTRSGGKDIVDHPSGGKDDIANALAGVVETAVTKRTPVGAL